MSRAGTETERRTRLFPGQWHSTSVTALACFSIAEPDGVLKDVTGKIRHFPVVLAGSRHWDGLETWIRARLLEAGIRRIAQKVGEEAVETVIAALAEDETALRNESADLLYHLLVLLRAKDVRLAQVIETLRSR